MQLTMNLKGKHVFSLIRMINKMNIKSDISKLIKIGTTNSKKDMAVTNKLKLALGDKEPTPENVEEILNNNEELKNELALVQENKRQFILDIAFFVMEKAADGEKEIYKLLSDIYCVTVEEIENLSVTEMIGAITNIISNEEMQQGFLSIFK